MSARASTARVSRRLPLAMPPTRGGRRPGAGRKPKGLSAGVPHRSRPFHDKTQPVHATLRTLPRLPNLRLARIFPAVRDALRLGSSETFRIVQFSVQRDHVHLLVEARDRMALMRGLRGLVVRLARAINRAAGRSGRVWADRYHTRALTTPREVRHALVYVLMNFRKHDRSERGIDLCSSGPWFTGWRNRPAMPPVGVEKPVLTAGTWLLSAGWRRHGLVSLSEHPKRL